MYALVNRVPQGMAELRAKFETHVHGQGLSAVEKCGEAVLNVSTEKLLQSQMGIQTIQLYVYSKAIVNVPLGQTAVAVVKRWPAKHMHWRDFGPSNLAAL